MRSLLSDISADHADITASELSFKTFGKNSATLLPHAISVGESVTLYLITGVTIHFDCPLPDLKPQPVSYH
jgi:hypothetical protein